MPKSRKIDKDLLARAIVVSLKSNGLKRKRLATYRKRLDDSTYYWQATRTEEVMYTYRILRLAQS